MLIRRVTKNGVIKAERNDELKEIGFKNRTRYYFDDIIEIDNFDNVMKNDTKKVWFIKFHTKLWLVQSHCVLGSKE